MSTAVLIKFLHSGINPSLKFPIFQASLRAQRDLHHHDTYGWFCCNSCFRDLLIKIYCKNIHFEDSGLISASSIVLYGWNYWKLKAFRLLKQTSSSGRKGYHKRLKLSIAFMNHNKDSTAEGIYGLGAIFTFLKIQLRMLKGRVGAALDKSDHSSCMLSWHSLCCCT